jgi:DNA processing protein
MNHELLYQVALTQVPELGPVHARLLIEKLGSASQVFKARKKELGSVPGIGETRAGQIKAFRDFTLAEKEMAFCHKHSIQPLFITEPDYPQQLTHCYDAPVLLYYRGTAALHNNKIISIIGTRSNTSYGKQVTEELVEALKAWQPLIISGLAFGIDAIAHKAALKQQLSTVGVLAHGFNTIYPAQHQALARELVEQQGGLLTEFGKNILPDKHNFPRRNRIVAGLSHATIVIETAVKGGSMITATLACGYNRDVFAVPGRTSDTRSSGCLQLIQQNKAILLTDATQLAETMGWEAIKKPAVKMQPALFASLSGEEKNILAFMQEKRSPVRLDEICRQTALTHSAAMTILLNLELLKLIVSLPGNRYQLTSDN